MMLVTKQLQQTIDGGLEITNRGTYLTTKCWLVLVVELKTLEEETVSSGCVVEDTPLANRLAPESGLASCGGGAAKMAVGLMGRGSVPYQSASTR
ncbi:hypothetical protein FA15DRAFT_675700 [Coprinopsis marcescibilis]|uniref:Uncharacterized protein n=1 Tax=Coprinopsis marcescibilis TaxID=230819 RepID=A0A5C3KD67_COPMA|nr:hypothetical protein FA15DRAFT_675700 [Coprinopsis marcescibilis]